VAPNSQPPPVPRQVLQVGEHENTRVTVSPSLAAGANLRRYRRRGDTVPVAAPQRERAWKKIIPNKTYLKKFLLNLFRPDRAARRALLPLAGCDNIFAV